MNENFVNIELNYDCIKKSRVIKYKLEGTKRLIEEKNPHHLSLKYLGNKECNIKRGNERDFPFSKVLSIPLHLSHEKLKKEKNEIRRVSIDSLVLNDNDKDEEYVHKKNKSEINNFFIKNKEDKGKIIIITDKDFFKKKHKIDYSNISKKENKSQKNFFENDILAPIEIKNLKNFTVSNFQTNREKFKKKLTNIPIKNTFIKERAFSYNERHFPERNVSNVSLIKDNNRNNNISNCEHPFGKKVKDFTRSNVHIGGIMSRIIGFRNKQLMSYSNNKFNEFIKIQSINVNNLQN